MRIGRSSWMAGIALALLACFAGVTKLDAVGQQNADYRIDRDVIPGGGGVSAGGSYRQTGTIGQSSPLGVSGDGILHINTGGFWHGGMAASPLSYTLGHDHSG